MRRKDVLAYARARLGMSIVPWNQNVGGLLVLTRTLYPKGDIGEPTYVRWENEQNPSGPAISLLGERQGQVLGAFTLVPGRYQIGHLPAPGGISVNTMTHPEVRGQGVFPILGQSALERSVEAGWMFVLGFPNPLSRKGFVHDLEFREVGQLPLWLLPLNAAALSRSNRWQDQPWIQKTLKVASPLVSLWTRWHLSPESTEWDVEEVKSVDESFDRLWQDVSAGYPNAQVRDRAFLHWRFLTHPTRRYRLYVVRREGVLKGYVVTRTDSILDLASGLLVDLLVANSAEGVRVARALIRRAIKDFREDDAALVASLMPMRSPGGRALRRVGFHPCPQQLLPQPFPVLIRWNRSGEKPPAALFRFSDWFLTMGDYDAV